jgi:hypothetical protein
MLDFKLEKILFNIATINTCCHILKKVGNFYPGAT